MGCIFPQENFINKAYSRHPVSLIELAHYALGIILPADKIPGKKAPVHIFDLIIEEKYEVVLDKADLILILHIPPVFISLDVIVLSPVEHTRENGYIFMNMAPVNKISANYKYQDKPENYARPEWQSERIDKEHIEPGANYRQPLYDPYLHNTEGSKADSERCDGSL